VNENDTQKLLADADFVTLTSGGNDVLGLAAAAAQTLTGKDYKKVSKIPAIVKNETVAKSLLKYLNDESVQAQLDEFLTSFANEYDTLLKQLRTASPNAIILVQTVYNPVSGSSYTALSDCIDTVMLRLNSIIRETVAEQMDDNILLVDIEKAFAGQSETYIRINEDDIHPTKEGHTAIAQALLNALASKETSTAVSASADAITNATANDSTPALSNNTKATNSEDGRIRFLTWFGSAFLVGIAVFLLMRAVHARR
jgi:lysophospholipase L1-like esterase